MYGLDSSSFIVLFMLLPEHAGCLGKRGVMGNARHHEVGTGLRHAVAKGLQAILFCTVLRPALR